MQKTFVASFCYNGAHGGGLRLSDDRVGYIEYRTNKWQLPDKYRRFEIPYGEIASIKPVRALSVFPAVIIETFGGERYKFIVFSRKKFFEVINKQINR